MASNRKRVAPASPNGDMPVTADNGDFQIPDDALLVVRTAEGKFGFVINGPSTVPPEAWPTALRRVAILLERQLVEG